MRKVSPTHVAIALMALLLPAQAQERQWSLDATGEDAFLVLGVPETDDVGLSFWCKIGGDSVSMFYPVTWTNLKNNSKVKVRIETGTRVFNLQGTGTASPEGGVASLEIPLKVNSKIFPAIKASDRLVLRVKGHRGAYPLDGADVDGLLKLCRKD